MNTKCKVSWNEYTLSKLKGLTEKEITVLVGRERGRTFQDLGDELGHSKQAAAYILDRAKAKLDGTYIFRGRGKPRDEASDAYTIHLTKRERDALMRNREIKKLIRRQAQPNYLKRALQQIFNGIMEPEIGEEK